MDFSGSRQFTIDVTLPPRPARAGQTTLDRPSPVAPVKLVSLYALQTSGSGRQGPGGFHFGDLQVTLASGNRIALDHANEMKSWQVLAITREPANDAFDISNSVLINGKPSGFFSWGAGLPASFIRGVRYGGPWQPLPAVMNKSFMEANAINTGDELGVSAFGGDIDVEIVAGASYFPTMNPNRNPFMVVSLWDTLERINIVSTNTDVQPGSLWLKSDDIGAVKASVNQISKDPQVFTPSVRDSRDLINSFRIDPLIAAGWRGLVLIAFVAALVISVSAYLLVSLFAMERQNVELAVLQAMGLTRRQWVISVVLEHALYLACGFAAGAFIGTRLAASIMPFLAVTEKGEKVVPPFLIETDWLQAGIIMGAVLLSFCAIITLTFLRVRRLQVVGTLRAGQL
jgi:hypothetical protein